jgi:sporulation protein YlmC with PRC-barrel domain
MSHEIDLALGVLDHQLVDSEGRRCGNVDDLELKGMREGAPEIEAILVGPPAWSGRGLVGKALAALARGRMVRVPWNEVKSIDSAVRLSKAAHELGLGRGDDRAKKLVAWIPGAK